MRSQKDNYLAIGSTLGMLTNEHTIVWGSGTIDDSRVLDCHPKKILAVRGPLTRQWLLKQGVDCPEVYGDPALLLPRLYTPSVQKKRYKLGIIPHYDDFNQNFSIRRITINGLYNENRRWYIDAYCHDAKDERTFRVDRISYLTNQKKSISLSNPSEILNYLKIQF